MPAPHRYNQPDSFRVNGHSVLSGIRAAPQVEGRTATPSEGRRRLRAGHHSPRQGQLDPWWEEPRNGLPVRLYVYHGTGRDAFDGTCLFDEVT